MLLYFVMSLFIYLFNKSFITQAVTVNNAECKTLGADLNFRAELEY